MDYPLENLGPERFQQLCQALLVTEFPGIACYPVGQPDGGRDATQRSLDSPSQAFSVYQVKFARSKIAASETREWVLAAAKGEVQKVDRLKQRGASNYVFITNVQGTAHLDRGSIDQVAEELSHQLDVPVICWWRDDICRRLDGNWNLKLRYPEVLSGQDFLRLLVINEAGVAQQRRLNAIKAFLVDQYTEDQDVKFKQVELQNKLLDLFVDLPFVIRLMKSEDQVRLTHNPNIKVHIRSHNKGKSYIHDDSTDESEAAGTATLILIDTLTDFLNQIVVEGAPGQGKSTLVQYLCQVHRIRLLSKAEELAVLPHLHGTAPVYIPFKVDLRDLAEWLVGGDPFAAKSECASTVRERTLETFLVRLVEHRGGGVDFAIDDLFELTKLAPIFLALDGLDEVADIKRRAEVVAAVTKSIARMKENCKGLRVLITSRPAAFANSPGFDPHQFAHLQLGSVRRKQIESYANKWMDARSLSSRERQEFNSILSEKLDQPHLRDLSRNPMQLTILLSLILTKGSALPDKRTALYDAYVDLFFSRESTKNPIVRNHLDLLKDIHRYLAWFLHSSAEVGKGAAAAGRLSSSELRTVLNDYLKQELQDTAVIEEIFSAMLERVVMIVSRIEGTHEFEVQPLREYFAGRFLYDTASYSPPGKEKAGTKPDRFEAIAKNFYWLNVTRFFCGCFSKGELLDLADRVVHLFNDNEIGKTGFPAYLAATLLSDWVFSQSPRAVAEIVPALTSPESLVKLTPNDLWNRNQEPMRIPQTCGGDVVSSKAVQLLVETSLPFDRSTRLAAFLQANLSSVQLCPHWIKNVPQSTDRLPEWLHIGSILGCTDTVHPDELTTAIQEHDLSSEAIATIWHLGENLATPLIETQSASIIEAVLSEPYFWGEQEPARRPLFLVGNLVSTLSGPGLTRQQAVGFNELFHVISAFESTQFENKLLQQPVSQLEVRCLEISKWLQQYVGADELHFNAPALWQSSLDYCAQSLGTYPLLIAASVNLTNFPQQGKGRARKVSLIEDGENLSIRLRYARSQRNNWRWWQETLESCKDDRAIFLAHYAMWSWVPISLICSNALFLTSLVEEMNQEQWNRLVQFVQFGALSDHRKNDTFTELPTTGVSRRIAFLLALRSPRNYARLVFLSYFRKNDDSVGFAFHFRQRQATLAAKAGDILWDEALEIIRFTYKSSSGYGVGSVSDIPESVAVAILERPLEYPVSLVEAAQARGIDVARKRIRPVAEIAMKERWFAR